jgi:hypothetical protein
MRPMNGAHGGGHDSGRFPIRKLVTNDEIQSERREKIRRFAIIGGGLTAAALLYLLVSVVDGAISGCLRSESRRRAVSAIVEYRDKATGTQLGDRFGKTEFTCAETGKPKGTLVAWRDSVDAIIWFVDQRGVPFNVNLLSQAWTPDLPPGPAFSPEQIRRVNRQDE